MSVLSFLDPAVHLARTAVAALATAVPTAVAIVLFTLAVRAALHPLARSAARAERARLRLAPRVARLRERHAGSPERLNRELLALHRAEGVGPFAGLLPVLLQAPFFSVMYRLFTTAPGHLLDATLVGVPLAAHPAAARTPAQFAVFAALEAALLALAWSNTRRAKDTATKGSTAKGTATKNAAAKGAPTKSAPGGAAAGPLRWLAFGTPLFALLLPLAGGLYLLTSTAWTAAERWYLHRPAAGPAGGTGPQAVGQPAR
ncbi:membrane protein insertase YidC [Kitasatospora phosalacinea]|uniref:Membrane protein insertase YidC n=1 Tax=Kitasatospora phosalacinea TaxID=2065 RepID=A0A9W6PH24_9ACTN|nr:membrane protein insertase YidC [Kitasatospora phosalacinea]GLW54966.1 protein translocase component YidC [Kitasatospora phosalacinea]